MKKPDILRPVVGPHRLNPGFVALMSSRGFAPARPVVQSVWSEFVDRDGNFLEQFQTTGFDARTWELFLFAFLRWDANADFDWGANVPDFSVKVRGIDLAIEAVTANPSPNDTIIQPVDYETSLASKLEHAFPIRLGGALYSKLQMRYWERAQIAGKPIILAIQDFHEKDSLHHSGASLWQYLYGFKGAWYFDAGGRLHISELPVTEHRLGNKVIPSGFFGLPDAEHISAVLFANTGTIPKFNRIGYEMGLGRDSGVQMIRYGLCYDHAANAAKPRFFRYRVGDRESPRETWGQGLMLFHNPSAKYPLPRQILPCAYGYIEEGRLKTFLPEFFPFVSLTHIIFPKRT